MFDTDVLAEAGELRERFTRLVASVGPDMPGELSLELLAEFTAIGRQADLGQCRSMERVDRSGIWQGDGANRSTVSFLKRELDESGGWIHRRLLLGRALADRLPETGKAWHDGAIGLDQAAEIRKAVADLDDELCSGIEKVLAQAAPAISLPELRRLGDMIRQQAAPEQAAERDRQNYLRQYLTLAQTSDGFKLDGWLDTETGALVAQALEKFIPKPTKTADGSTEPAETARLRRALALRELARQAVAHQACGATTAAKPTIIVTIRHDDLQHGLGAGDITGGGTVSAAATRRMACDADAILMTLDADGTPLNLGRKARIASSSQWLALIVRDKGCVFTGCDAGPAWTQAHHLQHWVNHGPTDLENLVLLCHHHHYQLHEGGWTHTGQPGPTLTFHPPDRTVRRC